MLINAVFFNPSPNTKFAAFRVVRMSTEWGVCTAFFLIFLLRLQNTFGFISRNNLLGLTFGKAFHDDPVTVSARIASVGVRNGLPLRLSNTRAAVVTIASLSTRRSCSSLSIFDPTGFQPVCPTSDGFYQIAKALGSALIGDASMAEYGPIIAGVLLRVRLELCVFESFFQEALLPFLRSHGLSWVLPFHETAETFIAGVVFAVAANFILLGSTKIFAVLMVYADVLLGAPLKLLSSALRLLPVQGSKQLAQLLAMITAGLSALRGLVESVDMFVGRFLVLGTTLYVLFKLLHFKVFV